MSEYNAEIYPKSPLIEAIFEVRFAGKPALECRRDEFHAAFEKKFPQVKVPTKDGSVPVFGIYRFGSDDGKEAILSSIRTVGYSTKMYPGFSGFKTEALRIVGWAIKNYSIKKLKRIGLRYTNVIPFIREDGIIPLHHFFNLKLLLPKEAPPVFEHFALRFSSRRNKQGRLTTRIEAGNLGSTGTEAFLLDFDFSIEGDLTSKNIRSYIDESHKHTKAFFNQLITPGYKKIMRGKVLS